MRTTSHSLSSTIWSSSFIRPLPRTTTYTSSCLLCVWPYGAVTLPRLALGAGVVEEFLCALDHGALLRGAGDGDAAAATEFEDALVAELVLTPRTAARS